MNANSLLRFEFSPDNDAQRVNDGWGLGMLLLNGKPYWFFGSDADPSPVSWTWIDFLEYLAGAWSALASEQSYPFDWLQDATHPGELWTIADRRWAQTGDSIADLEEPALIEFDRRHNLSAAWKGLGLPAVTCFRTGETVWLCPELGEPLRESLRDCLDSLREFGDRLASAYAGSSNPRVAAAVVAWRDRHATFRPRNMPLVTALAPALVDCVEESRHTAVYWASSSNAGRPRSLHAKERCTAFYGATTELDP
ncbi:protein of unknown function [Pararobbsia alpina]|uniref:hypothetical protein n=1 Tax=Pararobbsia alpina TaxID=621374 RepID=UPI0039A768CE